MNRSFAIGTAIALLFASTVMAADSNEQPARVLDETVRHIALAETGGSFLATTRDAGTTASPGAESFFLWENDGALRLSGSLDGTNCTFTECSTNPLAAALSGDGTRFAIATQPGGDGSNVIHFGTPNQGIVDTATLPIPDGTTDLQITGIDMDDSGTYVVVIGELEESLNPPSDLDDGLVVLYKWIGNVATEQWQTRVAGAATAVDVSADGEIATVAAAKNNRFDLQATTNAGTAFANQGVPGTAVAVATSSSPAHWSVLGTSGGYFAIFSDSSNSANSFQEYQRRDGSSPTQAVAMTEDGLQIAVGKADGMLYVYNILLASGGNVALVDSFDVGPGITALDYAGSGKYLAAAAGDEILFYHVADDLEMLWNETLTESGGWVETDATGDRVLAASGTNVLRFDALHQVTFTDGPDAMNELPATNASHGYTITNTGNRLETMAIVAAGPAEWNARTSLSTATLGPGESIEVDLLFDVPERQAPGDYPLAIHAVLVSTAASTTADVDVTVPATERWALTVQGSASKGVESGESTSFVVFLESTGNVGASPGLTASSTAAGWVITHDAPATLLPGEGSFVTVGVKAPANAQSLDVATVQIKAGAAQVNLTATVGARFDVALDVQSTLFEVKAGEELRFELVLTNTGNTLDSFTLAHGSAPAGWTIGFASGSSPLQIAELGANNVHRVSALVRPPADHDGEVPVELSFVARSIGDAAQTASVAVTIDVEALEVGGEETAPTPGIGLVLVLASVGSLVAFARRQRPF